MKSRNPFQAPEVKSRRGGPAKLPLSRDAIVDEALRQLTSAEGFNGMSLRKVALALETGPASLYAYVNDLRELHTLVLDRALGKVELPKAGLPWRERLTQLLESKVQVLAASPGLAQLAFGALALGPNGLRISETLLAILDEAGVDPATAAWAIDLLLLVTAVAAEHADNTDRVDVVGAVSGALSSTSQQDFPYLHAAQTELVSGTGKQRFSWAVDALIEGILCRPRDLKQLEWSAKREELACPKPVVGIKKRATKKRTS